MRQTHVTLTHAFAILPQVSSGTSSRAVSAVLDDEDTNQAGNSHSKNVGGIMYLPEYLLDCVLLCDSLREPNLLREVVGRPANAKSVFCVLTRSSR